MPPELSQTVSREAYQLALSQTAQAQAYLVTMAGVVSALGLFIGYRLFGLVQAVVTAINNNTTALQDLKERANEKG